MLRPLNDNVILKKEKVNNTTLSGIILSSHEKDEEGVAVCVAVGKGRYENGVLVPTQVKVNDKVMFKKYSSTSVKLDDEEYLVVAEKDIIAVIE